LFGRNDRVPGVELAKLPDQLKAEGDINFKLSKSTSLFAHKIEISRSIDEVNKAFD
jgi:hypothetical protein